MNVLILFPIFILALINVVFAGGFSQATSKGFVIYEGLFGTLRIGQFSMKTYDAIVLGCIAIVGLVAFVSFFVLNSASIEVIIKASVLFSIYYALIVVPLKILPVALGQDFANIFISCLTLMYVVGVMLSFRGGGE